MVHSVLNRSRVPSPVPARFFRGLVSRAIISVLLLVFSPLDTALFAKNALAISPATLPSGTLYVPYSETLTATGGASPYTYTYAISSGHLPAGLTLSSGGVISGTPKPSGIPRPVTSSNFTVQATDSTGVTGTQKYTISIYATSGGGTASPPTVTTTSLPAGTTGTAYSVTLAASGGTPPYIWTMASGSLPAGVSLTSSGVISGAPAASGNFGFIAQVSDSAGEQASATLSLTIVPALAVTSSSLPAGTVNAVYSSTLSATGGTSPYAWSILSGLLPGGTSLGTTTGTISGTPSAAGSYNFSVQVTDGGGRTASAAINLVIASALVITSTAMPGGTVGTAYSATLASSGGAAPVSWAVASGALPAGLSLSQAGVLSGTPTASGPFTFGVQASDALGQLATQSCTINVAAMASGGSLTIMNADLPNGVAGANYSVTLTANGGTPPYTWSVSGALPAGLTLDPKMGTISGTPSSAGWSNFFTLQAQDTANNTTSLQYSFIVNPVLDEYGGSSTLTCSATGWFHTQKIGNRWWLCDPLGNVFWANSMGGIDTGETGCDTSTGVCSYYQQIFTSKYGTSQVWGPQQNRRLQLWGFNSIGQKSTGVVLPTWTDPSWPGGTQPVKMPFFGEYSTGYSLTNLYSYANGPVKDMVAGVNQAYAKWGGPACPDLFDNNFSMWANAGLAHDVNYQAWIKSPYFIGWLSDDTDFLYGFGAGPDLPTTPAGMVTNNLALEVLITSPVQTYNASSQMFYSDPTVYTKTFASPQSASCSASTPCSLRDYLYNKYSGSIGALNSAWGSNYSTFDSTGTRVTGETIRTGDGTTTAFNYPLTHSSVSPYSMIVRLAGTPVAGDCPSWQSNCSIGMSGSGSLVGPAATGITGWLPTPLPSGVVLQQPCQNPACGTPVQRIYMKIAYHMSPGYYAGLSVEQWTNENQDWVASVQSPPAAPNVTGYDVYASTISGGETMQASNVPIGTTWVEPDTGLITGAMPPRPPASINYTTGDLIITFAIPPPVGAAITVDYTYGGWAAGGTGLMDEDGHNTAWVGTNWYCLEQASQCGINGIPLPNANPNLGADLDAWEAQYAGKYFGVVRSAIQLNDPNHPYFGPDTLGTWGAPPGKQILAAAGGYLDGLFTSWIPTQASLDYIGQYFGDKPIIDSVTQAATPDSAMFMYPGAQPGWDSPTQQTRGQLHQSTMKSLLNWQSASTGSYPFIGVVWWGLYDFWGEKIDWGIASLEDNPYDGRSATATVRTDPWGFSVGGPTVSLGGESRNYGDVIDYLKWANSMWLSLAH